MKIVFFIGSLAGGGAERVISILANHYCERGWDVEIALLLKNEVGYQLDDKIKIVDLVGRRSSYFENLFQWVRGIRKYLKVSRPDRIVSFIGRINALVLLSTWGMKIPVVVSERNDPKHDGRGRLMLALCNWCYGTRRCRAIVHQTQYEESCFHRTLARKSYVIPNPIEVKAKRAEVQRGRIVTAGRLIEQKNHAMLISAISVLVENFPEMCADIYGNGALQLSLQEQIDQKGLSETVHLRGNVGDLHQRMASADIFVMTSEFEGLSNALLEAMMLGLPCITTDYPGADEAIQNGENGLIVPRGNVYELAGAIARILTDDKLRVRLSENALKTSNSYKKENVLVLWENVIDNSKYRRERDE